MSVQRVPIITSGLAGRGEIRSLTGLRGLAAMLVVVFHFTQNNAFFQLVAMPGSVAHLGGTLIGHGYLAVDMFFVLSGFVMAISYSRLFAGGSTWAAYRQFLIRRFVRIYPLYIVVTLATAAMLAIHARPANLGSLLLSNVFLVQAWGISDSLAGPAWSISTEAAAYLLFPPLLAATVFGSRRVMIAMMTLAVVVLSTIALLPDSSVYGRVGPLDAHDCSTALPLLRCLAEFSLGLLTFRLAAAPAALKFIGRPGMPGLLVGTIVALLMLPGTDLPLVLLFPLLVLALATGGGLLTRVMGGRLLHTLGVLSYSLYLLHFRFIFLERWMREHLPHGWARDMREAIAVSVVFALLIGYSALTYVGIEKPCRGALQSKWMTRVMARARGLVPVALGRRRSST